MIELYRGYDKNYPNYGTKDGQNHLWTTDDEEYAYEYTSEFENGGLVKYLVDDSKFNVCDEFDFQEIFEDDEEYGDIDPIDADDEICSRLIDEGYNVLCFETPSGYDVYCIMDKSLIKSAQDVTPNIDGDLEEVFKMAGVKLDENDGESFEDKSREEHLKRYGNLPQHYGEMPHYDKMHQCNNLPPLPYPVKHRQMGGYTVERDLFDMGTNKSLKKENFVDFYMNDGKLNRGTIIQANSQKNIIKVKTIDNKEIIIPMNKVTKLYESY